MRRLTSLSMLLLMLLFAASPVLACIVPEPQMSAEEQSCCAQMAGDCGDMADSSMSGSAMNHSCCKKTTVTVQTLSTTDRVSHHVGTVLFAASPFSLALPSLATGFAPDWHLRINSPPPPPVSISVLRV